MGIQAEEQGSQDTVGQPGEETEQHRLPEGRKQGNVHTGADLLLFFIDF